LHDVVVELLDSYTEKRDAVYSEAKRVLEWERKLVKLRAMADADLPKLQVQLDGSVQDAEGCIVEGEARRQDHAAKLNRLEQEVLEYEAAAPRRAAERDEDLPQLLKTAQHEICQLRREVESLFEPQLRAGWEADAERQGWPGGTVEAQLAEELQRRGEEQAGYMDQKQNLDAKLQALAQHLATNAQNSSA